MKESIYQEMIQNLSRELANETLARVEFQARLKATAEELESLKKEMEEQKKGGETNGVE